MLNFQNINILSNKNKEIKKLLQKTKVAYQVQNLLN